MACFAAAAGLTTPRVLIGDGNGCRAQTGPGTWRGQRPESNGTEISVREADQDAGKLR